MGRQNDIRFRLSSLRESRGLTKAYIAEQVLDVSADQYAKIESGNRGLKTAHAIALADFYGVSCDYILRGVESENVDVWKEMGLANTSIAFIKAHKRYQLDKIFESSIFWRLIERIDEMTDYANDPEQAEREWDINGYIAHRMLDRLVNELRTDAIEYISYEDRGIVETIRDIRENGNEYEFEAEAYMIELKQRFNL